MKNPVSTTRGPEPNPDSVAESSTNQRRRLYESIARANRFTEVEQVAERALASETRNADQRIVSQ